MQFSKAMHLITVIALLISSLSGCASSFIEVRSKSEQVLLVDASHVIGCQSKGEINVSVLAEFGFVSRSVDTVEANLLQLARNGAVDAGGDTVVKGSSPSYGMRSFVIYKCRH